MEPHVEAKKITISEKSIDEKLFAILNQAKTCKYNIKA